ncbi:hypothetical protein ACFQLX_18170 [Streptomyces polyrhachis]|uniref:Secreted protein n=1 Tax=Streptomyces polyrhachis TaxID=1282885 RepID=A0ABW2GH20_9ACTN
MTTTAAVEAEAADEGTADAADTAGVGTAARRTGFTVAADGSYAACLATDRAENWYPERWTLAGPEPYAVPLPCRQPEEPDSTVLPLTDGRVLIRRRVDGRHRFSLLYPSGPATGEQPCGALEAPGAGAEGEIELIAPAPGCAEVFALVPAGESTRLWLVHDSSGGGPGPALAAELPGRCTGGHWLDRDGRLLAVDREVDGRTKTVAVDLGRGGEVSPLLQITAESNDHLVLADPDSGLLLVRSDAPGVGDRLGWGVLGSTRPVRFSLTVPDTALTPFAVQPGQVLTPERCGVALRLDGPAGSWLGVWRPGERGLHHLAPPLGWITGTGLWTGSGELRLPCATDDQLCGLARITLPDPGPRSAVTLPAPPERAAWTGPAPGEPAQAPDPDRRPARRRGLSLRKKAARPVPLGKAPMARESTAGG